MQKRGMTCQAPKCARHASINDLSKLGVSVQTDFAVSIYCQRSRNDQPLGLVNIYRGMDAVGVAAYLFGVRIVGFPWGHESESVELRMSKLDVGKRFVDSMDANPEAMTIEVVV